MQTTKSQNKAMHTGDDLLHRFIFDDTDIRGEIVTLQTCLDELFSGKNYPEALRPLLGEFMAAVSLLSSTLKFDGLLTLQARGDGPVSLIMAEASHNKTLRGIVKTNLDKTNPDQFLHQTDLPSLVGNGALSITIDPHKGNRYQGIVPLDAPSLADCLEHYFSQSEQLPTRLWLSSNGKVASGLLLQKLPQQVADKSANKAAWENRIQLANTITQEELLSLDHKSMLTRLFHEEGVRLFDPASYSFGCSCSKERSSRALQHLGQADVEELLLEQKLITIDCEFCGFRYSYDHKDIKSIFAPETRH